MTWQLRRAGGDDLEAIMTIETTVFVTDAWSPDVMRAELANPHNFYLVAFPAGVPERIEAYAGLFAPYGATKADIQTVAVAESARRGGLGRTLVQSLVNEARKRGADEVFLEVRADNPSAEQLYLAVGFEQIAVRTAYYQPDGVDALVMRLTIPEPRMAQAVSE